MSYLNTWVGGGSRESLKILDYIIIKGLTGRHFKKGIKHCWAGSGRHQKTPKASYGSRAIICAVWLWVHSFKDRGIHQLDKALVEWLSSAGRKEVGEAYCFGRLFCRWGITWGDAVRYGQMHPGDRAPGKPAEGTMSVRRLRVLERGLEYGRSLRRGPPQSLLNPGYFTSANLDLRALYPCDGYDEVPV